MRNRTIPIAALLLAAACASPPPTPEPDAGPEPATAIAALPTVTLESGPHVDWQQVSPEQFLAALVADGARLAELPADELARIAPAYTVWTAPPADWIDAASATRLEARVDSDRPALHVVSASSSVLPFGELSTEGAQARFLLRGREAGRYPPLLSSQLLDDR